MRLPRELEQTRRLRVPPVRVQRAHVEPGDGLHPQAQQRRIHRDRPRDADRVRGHEAAVPGVVDRAKDAEPEPGVVIEEVGEEDVGRRVDRRERRRRKRPGVVTGGLVELERRVVAFQAARLELLIEQRDSIERVAEPLSVAPNALLRRAVTKAVPLDDDHPRRARRRGHHGKHPARAVRDGYDSLVGTRALDRSGVRGETRRVVQRWEGSFDRVELRIVPYKRTSGWSSKASVGVERRRGRGLKPWCGRREAPGKVLQEWRSPRERGRMGTSV